MYTEIETNSKIRECRTWRLVWAMVPPSEGAGVGIRGVGVEGAGRVWALGGGTDVGVDDAGAGACAFAAETVVTRCCARLRSVLRWLTRRLEAPARRDGRVTGAVLPGIQTRYTSTVAKEWSGSGLSVPMAALVESRVVEVPCGACRHVPSALWERMEYRG